MSGTDSKAFLGVGLKFPVQTTPDLVIQMSSYDQDVKESIMIILQTAKGERLMRPDFGCGIYDFVFESMTTTTLKRIESSVREDLTQWEPRIRLNDVSVVQDETAEGRLLINISYTVITTNNRFNLVYPFYLTEGA